MNPYREPATRPNYDVSPGDWVRTAKGNKIMRVEHVWWYLDGAEVVYAVSCEYGCCVEVWDSEDVVGVR